MMWCNLVASMMRCSQQAELKACKYLLLLLFSLLTPLYSRTKLFPHPNSHSV